MMEDLISRVFATRNAAHIRHWTTKSYAEHMALGDFYTGIIETVDQIVEVHQGRSGLIDSVKAIPAPNPANIVQHLVTEADWIETHRDDIAERSETVGAIIDDLAAVYRKTIYKLENLR